MKRKQWLIDVIVIVFLLVAALAAAKYFGIIK